MSLEEVLETAAVAASVGATEALFTLGDRPEVRWPEAKAELRTLSELHGQEFASTPAYVSFLCSQILKSNSSPGILLPHSNAGLTTPEETRLLRTTTVSQGLMLETTATGERLKMAHNPQASPSKNPNLRLAWLAEAGRARVPTTSGLLVGIGETRRERLETLLALRDIHCGGERSSGGAGGESENFSAGGGGGHLQEIIVQPFQPKKGTRMGDLDRPPPSASELLWTVAVARLVMGPAVGVQSPPNLSPVLPWLSARKKKSSFSSPSSLASPSSSFARDERDAIASWRVLLRAGADDFGGVRVELELEFRGREEEEEGKRKKNSLFFKKKTKKKKKKKKKGLASDPRLRLPGGSLAPPRSSQRGSSYGKHGPCPEARRLPGVPVRRVAVGREAETEIFKFFSFFFFKFFKFFFFSFSFDQPHVVAAGGREKALRRRGPLQGRELAPRRRERRRVAAPAAGREGVEAGCRRRRRRKRRKRRRRTSSSPSLSLFFFFFLSRSFHLFHLFLFSAPSLLAPSLPCPTPRPSLGRRGLPQGHAAARRGRRGRRREEEEEEEQQEGRRRRGRGRRRRGRSSSSSSSSSNGSRCRVPGAPRAVRQLARELQGGSEGPTSREGGAGRVEASSSSPSLSLRDGSGEAIRGEGGGLRCRCFGGRRAEVAAGRGGGYLCRQQVRSLTERERERELKGEKRKRRRKRKK